MWKSLYKTYLNFSILKEQRSVVSHGCSQHKSSAQILFLFPLEFSLPVNKNNLI